VTVEAADDGHLTPVVEAMVPQRALVFEQRPDGAFAAQLDVSVTARRGDRQAGGGVGTATARVLDVADARSDTPVRVRVPLLLRGQEPVSLTVSASQRGTVRRWQQTLSLSPATLAAAPLVIERADMPTSGEHLDTAVDTLTISMACLRPVGAGAWPAAGVTIWSEVTGPGGEVAGAREVDVPGPPSPGTTVMVDVAWPVDELPFGRLVAGLGLQWRHAGEPLRLPHEPLLEVVNLQVPLDNDRAWRQHLDWLDGLVADDRLDGLGELPVAARPVAWRGLWRDLGASQGLRPEVARRQHLQRVVRADARFGGDRRGALTDRGRVLVRWGEPDRIEQVADSRVPGAVWEIWTYDAPGLRFSFHDAHGLGDSRLRRTEPLRR
jgi:GWxTD domain-containing protein